MKIRMVVFVLALATIVASGVGGYFYYQAAELHYLNQLEDEFGEATKDLKNHFAGLIAEYQREVRVLVRFEELERALKDPTQETLAEATRILSHVAARRVGDVCYLMDRGGNTISSSNYHDPDSFVGKNYSFRPYFSDAMKGRDSIFMGLGVTSNERGVYFGYPVMVDGSERPAGVAVIKASIDPLESAMSRHRQGIVMVVHKSGVIFLSSQSDWALNTLWKLPNDVLARIGETKQFGTGPWKWTGMEWKSPNRAVDSSGEPYVLLETEFDGHPDWRIVALSSLASLSQRLSPPWLGRSEYGLLGVLFIVAAAIVALFTLAHRDIQKRQQAEKELLKTQSQLNQTVKSLEASLSQQRKIEESLRDSEERYRTFFDTSQDAVFMTTVDGRLVDFNDVAMEMLGYDTTRRQAIACRRVSEFYTSPEEREKHIATVAKSGFSKEYPVDFRKADGSIIHTLITTVARKDPEGNVIGFQGTIRDVTDKKKAEEALRKSEANYRFLAEHASDVLWTVDLNLRTTYVSPSILQVLGFAPEERMRQTVEDQLTPESLAIARNRLREELCTLDDECLRSERSMTMDLDYLHKNGSIVCLQSVVSFIRDRNGYPVGLHGISRDITRLKRAQLALKESEEKYRTVVEESFDGVFVQNETVITFANSRLHEMLGYEPGELEGLDHWMIYHPDYQDTTRSRAQSRLRGESVVPRYEVMLRRKDGSSFPGEINAKVILFNKAPQIQVWIRDLTEQRRLEKKLVHAQKMEAIGTLTGGIAHDFNNLLTIINGFTEMILLETPEDDPRYADLQKILKAGGKGAEMIQRLLTFNQNGGSSPQLVDLNLTVQNSIKLASIAFPKPLAIETALGKRLSMVNADAAQMEQVLVNLFVNAAEATADGGKLKIETRNVRVGDDDGEHHVSVTPGTYVLITVADTGCGMDSETLDRIFDPFFTTKGWDFRKGTGLGLSVAKGIVELHGGRITCKSQLGEGTTFSVHLPVVPESAGRGRPETSVSRVPGTGTVLLVDDEELVLELGKRILERAGYPVITAVNGREALDIYKRERSSIGLVVLDLLMPEMDGEQCLEELLKIDPEAIVLVSSGHSLSPQEQDCLAAHAKGFVNKPYQVDQLIQAVRDLV